MRGIWIALAAPILAAAAEKVDFERDVKPILEAKCFSCHGGAQAQSGLRLDLRQNALRGGDYGVVIVPGNSAASKMILRLTGSSAGLQMPPSGALESEDVAVLRAWIDQGAEMPGRAADVTPKAAPATDPKVQSFLDAVHRNVAFAKLKEQPDLAKAADGMGSTALMHAAYAGSLEMMRALIDAGADLRAANQRKATPLHWAVSDAAKVKLLLARGADVNAKSVDGRTALHMAAMQPAGVDAVRALLEGGADANAKSLVGATPLFASVAASLESTRLLIAKGADVNAKTGTGATALMAAAFRYPDAAALLIEKGADVKAATKRGETALANAANGGNLGTALLLLEKGADANTRDYRGYTPLMHAAYRDNAPLRMVEALVEKGCDVKATGEGETAFTLAAKHGDTDVTKFLREAGK